MDILDKKKNIRFVTVLIVVAFILPSSVNALSTPSLLLQIQSLLKIVQQLQTQLAALNETPPTTITTPTPTLPTFCSTLSTTRFGIGLRSLNVIKLQQFLKQTGDFTYPEFTQYYGQVTKRAVQSYQCREMGICSGTIATTGYGLAGPGTRRHMCTSKTIIPTPTPRIPGNLVCGQPSTSTKAITYLNKTMMYKAFATFLHDGVCTCGDNGISCSITPQKVSYSWNTTNWNTCTNNTQTRTATCKGSDNKIYSDNKCLQTKPKTTQSCTVFVHSCIATDGSTIQSGQTESRVRYQSSTVPYGQSCKQEAQRRTCNDGSWGEWSGVYTSSSCSIDLLSQHLIVTSAYQVNNRNYIELGVYYFLQNNQVLYKRFYFDPEKNWLGNVQNFSHYYTGDDKQCQPSSFVVPRYEEYKISTGSVLSYENHILEMNFGGEIHRWHLDEINDGKKIDGLYTLVSRQGTSRALGFGFFSKTIRTTPITTDNLGSYSGFIYQNSAAVVGTTTSPISFLDLKLNTGFTPRSLVQNQSNPDILGLTYLNGDTYAPYSQSTIVLNLSNPYKSMVYSHSGHVFGGGDCYTDKQGGHKTMYLGVWNDMTSKIDKFVSLQYSHEADGYPIIAIGVFY